MGSENNLSETREKKLFGGMIGLLLLFTVILMPLIPLGASQALLSDRITQTSTVTVPAAFGGGATVVFFPKPFKALPIVSILNESVLSGTIDIPYTVVAPGAVRTWTAMPAAQTELFGESKNRFIQDMVNSGGYTMNCALAANVVTPGFAGAILRLQSSPDLVTWSNVYNPVSNGDVPISTTGFQFSNGGFAPVALAGVSVFMRVVGIGGNGVVSPSFGNIEWVCSSPSAFSSFVTAASILLDRFTLSVNSFLPPVNATSIAVTWSACSQAC